MPYNQVWQGSADPMGELNAEKQQLGATGTQIASGGADNSTLGAGGANQWALGIGAANRANAANIAQGGKAAATDTNSVAAAGGQYAVNRSGAQDQFTLSKYSTASQDLAGGSKYTPSPLQGILQGLIGGVTKGAIGSLGNLGGGGGSDADPTALPGQEATFDNPNGGIDPDDTGVGGPGSSAYTGGSTDLAPDPNMPTPPWMNPGNPSGFGTFGVTG